jgi:hypothetical protein
MAVVPISTSKRRWHDYPLNSVEQNRPTSLSRPEIASSFVEGQTMELRPEPKLIARTVAMETAVATHGQVDYEVA